MTQVASYAIHTLRFRLFRTTWTQLRHQSSPLTPQNALMSLYATSCRTHFPDVTEAQSLTISYLQKAYAMSSESATSASKKLLIVDKENPDKVLSLLTNHGLTQTHISKLIGRLPRLLLADLESTLKPNLELFASLGISGASLDVLLNRYPRILESDAKTMVEFFRDNGFSETQIAHMIMKKPVLYACDSRQNFKPKLEFFESLGFSKFDVAKLFSVVPYVLASSLEKVIIPRIQILRQILGTDANVLKAVKASFWSVDRSLENFDCNRCLLINHGVSESLILKIFCIQPRVLLQNTDRLNEIIGEVKVMGFKPTKLLFLLAIRSLTIKNKALWLKKLEAYRSFGMSKDEVYSAFKLQPQFMDVSVKKIMKLMDFYVNKLNLKPSMISKSPSIMMLSLETRIIPRCSVLLVLISRELARRDITLSYILSMSEEFMKKFVSKYRDVVPEVVDAYVGNIQFGGFPKGFEWPAASTA